MRLLIILCLGGLLASAAADDIDVLTNYDLEPALKDEAKWKVLFDCYMERQPCGEMLQGVKEAMVRLFVNKCEKCTPELKGKFDTMLKRTGEKYPKDLAELINKYSPKPE